MLSPACTVSLNRRVTFWFERENITGAKKGGGTIAYYAGAVSILFALFSAMTGALSLIDERRSGVADRILAAARS